MRRLPRTEERWAHQTQQPLRRPSAFWKKHLLGLPTPSISFLPFAMMSICLRLRKGRGWCRAEHLQPKPNPYKSARDPQNCLIQLSFGTHCWRLVTMLPQRVSSSLSSWHSHPGLLTEEKGRNNTPSHHNRSHLLSTYKALRAQGDHLI